MRHEDDDETAADINMKSNGQMRYALVEGHSEIGPF
jgi:hypothetical protein